MKKKSTFIMRPVRSFPDGLPLRESVSEPDPSWPRWREKFSTTVVDLTFRWGWFFI